MEASLILFSVSPLNKTFSSENRHYSAVPDIPVSLEFIFHHRFFIESNGPKGKYSVNSTEACASLLIGTY